MRVHAVVAAMVIGGLSMLSWAGPAPTPGATIAADAGEVIDGLLLDYLDDGQAITDACIAKMALLDSRNAPMEALEATASASVRKLFAVGNKNAAKINKVTTRAVGQLGRLLEEDVLAQITSVLDDRAMAVGAFFPAFEDFSDQIGAAFEAEIAD